MNSHLLLIEDDQCYNHVLSRALDRRGFNVTSALTLEQGLNLTKNLSPHFIILDLNLDGKSGLSLMPSLLKISPNAKILILTGYASISTAVEAMKLGAWDYLPKPTTVENIVNSLTSFGKSKMREPEAPKQFMSVPRMEWEYIQRVLAEHDGNIAATARALKMHRRTLQRKLIKRPPVK
ncbi:MAG: response regulator [Chromatiales bacterium]|jgi:two-component system response regulator RegA